MDRRALNLYPRRRHRLGVAILAAIVGAGAPVLASAQVACTNAVTAAGQLRAVGSGINVPAPAGLYSTTVVNAPAFYANGGRIQTIGVVRGGCCCSARRRRPGQRHWRTGRKPG